MKRLYLDLEKCNKCQECAVKCSYFYHPQNNGIVFLREFATFSLICRHCEQGLCVASCPQDALEKQPDNIIKRYNMRCVSCKSCLIACPFGTIIPEIITYKTAKCDFCLAQNIEPSCIKGCPDKAIEYKEVNEDKKNHIFMINDKLVVRAISWKKE